MQFAVNHITPYNELPITLAIKATRQKVYRELHCMECGNPIAEITDKVVFAFDGETEFERLEPNRIGVVNLHCKRHSCKQYFRLEFAV